MTAYVCILYPFARNAALLLRATTGWSSPALQNYRRRSWQAFPVFEKQRQAIPQEGNLRVSQVQKSERRQTRHFLILLRLLERA